MNRHLRARALVGTVASLALLSIAVPVDAASPPFADSNVNGSIGFCNKQGHPITSGSIYDQPFVWTAVSSTPAPDGYQHGKAVLIAYQPRKDVDPGEWSGRQLTAASSFTNPAHPMTQATNGDDPLLFFVQAFPPKWNGLVQLRMYFGARNTPEHQAPYPATTIQVLGDRWNVVAGGPAPCHGGKATSDETLTLPKAALASAPPLEVAGHTVANATPTASADASSAPDVASATPDSTGSGPSIVMIGLLVVAAVGGGGGAFFIWRLRRAAGGG